MDIKEAKKQLRSAVRKKEKQLDPEYRAASDKAICENVLSLPEYQSAQSVFLFVGTSKEINTDMIIEDAFAQGKTVAVPLCTGDGIMELKVIKSLKELRPGTFGILEPEPSCPGLSPDMVDFVLFPCVSCNKKGQRLGQGGGFYDRFIEKYHGNLAIVCRQQLMEDDIPMEDHDAVLPLIVSEEGVFRI